MDISHRLRHIKQKPKNWKAFRDPKEKTFNVPIMPVIKIATALAYAPYPKNRLIFASGRLESERHDTVRSLSKWFLLDGWHDVHNILDFIDDYIFIDTLTKIPTPKKFKKMIDKGESPYTPTQLIEIRDYLISLNLS